MSTAQSDKEPRRTTPEGVDDGDSAARDSAAGDSAAGDWALMRYLDGELEPELAAEIEARIAADSAARDKRAGLALVAALLREGVDADRRADGIADAVMSRLDADSGDGGGADAGEVGADHDVERHVGVDGEGGASPRSERRGRAGSSASGPAANDNGRVIFALATAAAAVAAGLFIWGTTEPDDGVALGPQLEPPAEIEPAPLPFASNGREAAPTAEVEAEEAPQPVEVAAVDFGSQSGSVFYVSGQHAATAVVWVTGGEEP